MRAIGRIGGLVTSATHDSRERTANARATFASSFEQEIRERFPELDDDVEIARRAEALRKLHYARMGMRSGAARRAANGRPTDGRSDAPDPTR